MAKFNVYFCGSTNWRTAETSPVSFQTTPDDPLIMRVETVGRVQPHVKAKIIDGDGNVVDVGKPGEICIAGYLLQNGYTFLLCSPSI